MMITRVSDGQLLIVTQPHHAELAGQLAAHWGNDEFHELDPRIPMIVATKEHDNGWREWDNRPTIDPEQGLPWTFANLSYVEHAKLYWRGILRAAEDDIYEGLMVCMHGRGLYNKRNGTDLALKRVPQGPGETVAVNRIAKNCELLQKKLRKRLAANPQYRRQASDIHIWTNYCLLQVFDRVALHVCWKGMVPYTVDPVPTAYEKGRETSMSLEPISDSTFKLLPYPFREKPLDVSVTGCLVPLHKYRTQEEFRDEYYNAERVELKFRFT